MYSFDVFDTLITRTTATPRGIFAIMERELRSSEEYSHIPEYIRNNFFMLRINAEKLARATFCKGSIEDVTIAQIYDALGMTGALTPEDRERLIALEQSIEYQNVIGIKENIEKVKALLSRNEKVVAISDMYLDEATIKKMLIKVDSVFEQIKLYVSSTYRKTKGSGNLYWIVKEKEGCEFNNWNHTGDNIETDVNAPLKVGIRSEHYSYINLTPYENMRITNEEADVHVQITIGAAKNARLLNFLKGRAEIGCSLGGVMLFPYVNWLLEESLKRGIKRLYFIARDGYVLKKIADIIIAKLDMNIATYYIYGSRRAWRIAAINRQSFDVSGLFQVSHINYVNSIPDMADVFQIPVEEFIQYLPTEYQASDRKLNYGEIAEIKAVLMHNRDFLDYLENTHYDKRQRVLKYMEQEVDFSDDAFAFVELAGSGFTQICLAEVLKDIYDKPIQTFYYKLDKLNSNSSCIFYDFLPSRLYLHVIIEMLCRAPHGQTIDYREEDGRMSAVFERENAAILQHGFNEYTQGVECFVELYIEHSKLCPVYMNGISLLLKYYDYITLNPDPDLLEFIGGMPNDVTGRAKEIMEFAPILTKEEIRMIYLFRTNQPIENYYKGTSLDYSLLRCSARDKKQIEFCTKHNNSIIGKGYRLLYRIKEGDFRSLRRLYLKPKTKVILYAAGKVGQDLYKKLKSTYEYRVVLWVDVKFEEYRKLGLPVSSPNNIEQVEFDRIIIAVIDDWVAEDIKSRLVKRGIPADKILWIASDKMF